ncbi:MAG: GNAT family N-acetyltransferase [Phyllobacterium sp.]
MSLVIRQAQPSDALNLAALSVQIWLHTYARAGMRDVLARYVLTQFTPARLAEDIADETRHLLVAAFDGCLVGYAAVRFESACPVRRLVRPEVERLYVQAHFAGRGIGGSLLERVFDLLRQRNEKELWLSVNGENEAARRFYRGKLFRKIGTADFELESERHANDVLVRAF